MTDAPKANTITTEKWGRVIPSLGTMLGYFLFACIMLAAGMYAAYWVDTRGPENIMPGLPPNLAPQIDGPINEVPSDFEPIEVPEEYDVNIEQQEEACTDAECP